MRYNEIMRQNGLTVADFFAGIGGLRMGFEKAGYKIVYSNDIDKNCCKTYRDNFGEIDERDIREVQPDLIPDFDVLIGGFPCQPFSMIGKRRGLNDDRGKLFFELIRIMAAKRPKAFLLENVRHLLKHENGKSFEIIKQNLEWLGYKVFKQILNSADFGVPQRRERLYIVGFLNQDIEFEFPKKKSERRLKDILEKRPNEAFYLSEKYYSGLLAHKERHQEKGSGFGCEILDPEYLTHTLVAGNMGRERNLIQDAPTNKNRWGIRRLTARECARLQGFPESFKLPVHITVAYKQLGNAVTVPVAQAIAVLIKKILLNNPISLDAIPSSPALGQLASGMCQKTTAA